MPKPSSPLERCNAVLQAFEAPFRLRQHRRSQWISVYEILAERCTRERSLRGYPAADTAALERLCDLLLSASKQGLSLEAVVEPAPSGNRPCSGSPCWPEICQAVVTFQRGQGVNMNLVEPFKGQGYFRLLPQDRPASLDVWHIDGLPDGNGLFTIGVAARHIKVTKTGFRAAVPLPAAWVDRYQLGGANGEQLLAELRTRHRPKFVNEDGQPFDPERDQLKRCDNNERLGAVCCHKLRSSDAKAEFQLRTVAISVVVRSRCLG
jgi:hypothetical protein